MYDMDFNYIESCKYCNAAVKTPNYEVKQGYKIRTVCADCERKRQEQAERSSIVLGLAYGKFTEVDGILGTQNWSDVIGPETAVKETE